MTSASVHVLTSSDGSWKARCSQVLYATEQLNLNFACDRVLPEQLQCARHLAYVSNPAEPIQLQLAADASWGCLGIS